GFDVDTILLSLDGCLNCVVLYLSWKSSQTWYERSFFNSIHIFVKRLIIRRVQFVRGITLLQRAHVIATITADDPNHKLQPEYQKQQQQQQQQEDEPKPNDNDNGDEDDDIVIVDDIEDSTKNADDTFHQTQGRNSIDIITVGNATPVQDETPVTEDFANDFFSLSCFFFFFFFGEKAKREGGSKITKHNKKFFFFFFGSASTRF
ncbi:hypothetical protein RFI_09012, partial [Reticulomyxa filosa]